MLRNGKHRARYALTADGELRPRRLLKHRRAQRTLAHVYVGLHLSLRLRHPKPTTAPRGRRLHHLSAGKTVYSHPFTPTHDTRFRSQLKALTEENTLRAFHHWLLNDPSVEF